MPTTVRITIDNQEFKVAPNLTILQAARQNGFDIPTFCHQPFLDPKAACRICVVEDKQSGRLVASCSTPVREGLVVETANDRIDEARRVVIELLLANHRTYCPTCQARDKCTLLKYARRYAIGNIRYIGKRRNVDNDTDYHSIVHRDQSKCILCGKCVEVCRQIIGVEAIDFKYRGFATQIGSAYDKDLYETRCINCGQCVNGCPTGAIFVHSDTATVSKELRNPARKVIFQTAPSIRAALGEEFGLPAGTIVTGKLVAALKKLGAYKVFQTDFGADLTIMEEGYEFLRRLEADDHLPMFTSCCPSWQKYIEHNHPGLIPHLSSCKSPQQMTGSIIKNWYAREKGLSRDEVTVVSIMPCSAKKWEVTRPGCAVDQIADCDYVLTARELADLIRANNIDFSQLKDEDYDSVLGEASGAGEIFAATGGVMEAALRTVVEKATGKPLTKIDFTNIRGMKRVKEASLEINGKEINILIISGLANAKPFLKEIAKGKSKYHFIEIMTCPGGCINGGGMPFYESFQTVQRRYDAIFNDDRDQKIRKSHENPAIIRLYNEFLGEPGNEEAHHLLHTPYIDRSDVI